MELKNNEKGCAKVNSPPYAEIIYNDNNKLIKNQINQIINNNK